MRKLSFLLLLFLGLIFSLVSCSAPSSAIGQSPVKSGQGPKPTLTFTPFQVASPTPRPTQTLTPTPLPSPTQPQCLEETGRIERKEEVVRENRPPLAFRVYFPPCFDQDQTTRYPVLYMIHGQTFGDDQWERLGIGDAADKLIHEKEAPPFLIVMPLERDTFEDIYLAGFSGDVVDGLIPWIDSTYPTCAERACRAIGGLSRGGAWALHLGFIRWELFGSVGLHSTPPFTSDPTQFPIWLRDIPSDQLPRIWMDTGRQDAWIQYTKAFESLLAKLNVAHEWTLNEGQHEEAYWSEHVEEYLEWYSQPWKSLPVKSLSR